MTGKSAGLVLAAGKGSRFAGATGDNLPKVLRRVLGKPIIAYVLDALKCAGIRDVTLVVGYGADQVMNEVGGGVRYARQTEQKGSGHAVACARETFADFDGILVIMCGDSPLFTAATISAILNEHKQTQAAISLASARLDDPFGYGRIVRDSRGAVSGIVEEKCANESEKAIQEVNGGVYAFDSRWLFDNIDKMAINEAGEYNLTDMVRVAVAQNRTVATIECDPQELTGVNTPDQLLVVEEVLRGR